MSDLRTVCEDLELADGLRSKDFNMKQIIRAVRSKFILYLGEQSQPGLSPCHNFTRVQISIENSNANG